ncbi:MAG: hypothetical protein ACE5F6_07285 [Anaerolineae bacterium]
MLNDHLFKAIAPSWLTGKISDFAGLFFFPFFLAVLLSVLLGRHRRLSPMTIGRTAFTITAIWFALAKATPLGHALTVQVISALLGHEIAVELDPTDLIALAALWPAWRLWCAEVARDNRDVPLRASLIVVVLAALAGVATSPPYQEIVVRLVVMDNQIYALTKYGPASRLEDSAEWRLYKSSDDGRTWSQVTPIPEAFTDEMARLRDDEVIAKQPGNPQVLYRINAEERVEYSEDGGNTWRTVWEIPAGRRLFMQRYRSAGLLPGPPIVMGPYDLAFTPDGSGTLVVAMGTEGVLVRDPPGVWSRHVVGMAGPTPFSTLYPSQWLFLLIFPEGLALAILTALVALMLSMAGWTPILRAVRRAQGGRKAMWVLRPAIAAFAVLVILAVGGYIVSSVSATDGDVLAFLVILFLLLPVVFLFVLAYTWSRVIGVAGDEVSARHARAGCMWTTLGLLVAGGLPFVLWTAGIIPWYAVALAGAIIFGVTIASLGVVHVYRYGGAAGSSDA